MSILFVFLILFILIFGFLRKAPVKTIFEERREKMYKITGNTKPIEESWDIFKPNGKI